MREGIEGGRAAGMRKEGQGGGRRKEERDLAVPHAEADEDPLARRVHNLTQDTAEECGLTGARVLGSLDDLKVSEG